VTARAHERAKLERLCRNIARPAVSTQRLSLARNSQVSYELKTPSKRGKDRKTWTANNKQDQTPACSEKSAVTPMEFENGATNPVHDLEAAIVGWCATLTFMLHLGISCNRHH